jgi:hypothetical protein
VADSITSQVLGTELAINEIAVWAPPSPANVPDLQRMSNLLAYLQSTKLFFEAFLAKQPGSYNDFGFATFALLSHGCFSLYKLTTLDDPNWDKQTVRQTIDVLQILDQLVENFMKTADEAGIVSVEPDFDVFTRSAKPIKSMRAAWESLVVGPPVGVVTPATDVPPMEDVVMDTALFNMDFSESLNGWITDMYYTPYGINDLPV